jgi:hypothetical protein
VFDIVERWVISVGVVKILLEKNRMKRGHDGHDTRRCTEREGTTLFIPTGVFESGV